MGSDPTNPVQNTNSELSTADQLVSKPLDALASSVENKPDHVEPAPVDSAASSNTASQTSAVGQTETEEDPLGDYFKTVDEAQAAKAAAAPAADLTIPSAPVQEPIKSPEPIAADDKIKKTHEDPIVAEQKRAMWKNIIKWIVVIINFALSGALFYYYFVVSKK